jgi:hypothetical protein
MTRVNCVAPLVSDGGSSELPLPPSHRVPVRKVPGVTPTAATLTSASGQGSNAAHAPVAMQCLAERARGEFHLGQSQPWSFGDEPADPPRRRPLVPIRVIAVEQDRLERIR